jgi:pimeloyl-ACP methyl ester carboxylesterase
VIVSVVVGDNVAAEIVWGAISVMLAGPDTHPGPQQNPTRCSPAQCPATGIVLSNNGFERSVREDGSVGQIVVDGADVSDRAFPATAGPSGGVDGLATQLDRLAGYAFGTAERSVQLLIPALGQQIRVSIRAGSGVPLVLCNGIGVGLEVLDPLVDQLDPNTTVVRFDVPGVGDSPNSPLPYSFPYLAAVLGQVLSTLGLGGEGVDVLGLSWGGCPGAAVRLPEPTPLSTADLGVDGRRHRDGAGSTRGAGEIGYPTAISGPRLCRQDRR